MLSLFVCGGKSDDDGNEKEEESSELWAEKRHTLFQSQIILFGPHNKGEELFFFWERERIWPKKKREKTKGVFIQKKNSFVSTLDRRDLRRIARDKARAFRI